MRTNINIENSKLCGNSKKSYMLLKSQIHLNPKTMNLTVMILDLIQQLYLQFWLKLEKVFGVISHF